MNKKETQKVTLFLLSCHPKSEGNSDYFPEGGNKNTPIILYTKYDLKEVIGRQSYSLCNLKKVIDKQS